MIVLGHRLALPDRLALLEAVPHLLAEVYRLGDAPVLEQGLVIGGVPRSAPERRRHVMHRRRILHQRACRQWLRQRHKAVELVVGDDGAFVGAEQHDRRRAAPHYVALVALQITLHLLLRLAVHRQPGLLQRRLDGESLHVQHHPEHALDGADVRDRLPQLPPDGAAAVGLKLRRRDVRPRLQRVPGEKAEGGERGEAGLRVGHLRQV
eukprot:1180982-Prorocentrum_minimum.AAC.3